jgi:hypothetical protein
MSYESAEVSRMGMIETIKYIACMRTAAHAQIEMSPVHQVSITYNYSAWTSGSTLKESPMVCDFVLFTILVVCLLSPDLFSIPLPRLEIESIQLVGCKSYMFLF